MSGVRDFLSDVHPSQSEINASLKVLHDLPDVELSKNILFAKQASRVIFFEKTSGNISLYFSSSKVATEKGKYWYVT